MLEFLVDNIFVVFGGKVFKHVKLNKNVDILYKLKCMLDKKLCFIFEVKVFKFYYNKKKTTIEGMAVQVFQKNNSKITKLSWCNMKAMDFKCLFKG